MNTMPTPMPTPTPTAVVTVPVAILTALSRAIGGWTAAVYPGTTTHLEAASRDPAARRLHTWHAVACLSNGVRLRFTLIVQDDGLACVTRHARLARRTLPVWLYVSVTGVVVYWMLYWLFP